MIASRAISSNGSDEIIQSFSLHPLQFQTRRHRPGDPKLFQLQSVTNDVSMTARLTATAWLFENMALRILNSGLLLTPFSAQVLIGLIIAFSSYEHIK